MQKHLTQPKQICENNCCNNFWVFLPASVRNYRALLIAHKYCLQSLLTHIFSGKNFTKKKCIERKIILWSGEPPANRIVASLNKMLSIYS